MLKVCCLKCGKTVLTRNGADPDSELECGCCPQRHNHAGLGCRPVNITVVVPARVRPGA